eukprot:13484059-Alexandrium_andersonii.AAC.1
MAEGGKETRPPRRGRAPSDAGTSSRPRREREGPSGGQATQASSAQCSEQGQREPTRPMRACQATLQRQRRRPSSAAVRVARGPARGPQPVSYTHLTLPTICSV